MTGSPEGTEAVRGRRIWVCAMVMIAIVALWVSQMIGPALTPASAPDIHNINGVGGHCSSSLSLQHPAVVFDGCYGVMGEESPTCLPDCCCTGAHKPRAQA